MNHVPRSASLALLLAVTLVVAACTTGGTPSAPPSPTPTAPAPASAPGTPSPSGSPSPGGFYLRAWLSQAIPPREAFARWPQLTIAGGRLIDGMVAIPAIYPGPLYVSFVARTISDEGVAAVADELRSQGLLGGVTDFGTAGVPPGGPVADLELIIDGTSRSLVGDPTRVVRCSTGTRCVPDPGTPEAFAAFWQRLGDTAGWLGGALGPQGPYEPERVAVLIVAPEPAQAGIEPGRATWPLAALFAGFGAPFPSGPGDRCAVVSGPDLALLLPAVQAANQLTRFVDAAGVKRSLVVRPLVPGEPDPCPAPGG